MGFVKRDDINGLLVVAKEKELIEVTAVLFSDSSVKCKNSWQFIISTHLCILALKAVS